MQILQKRISAGISNLNSIRSFTDSSMRVAGMLAICIALFTVSFQAIKAAISNPVNNLRTQ